MSNLDAARDNPIYKVFALPFFGWLRNILPPERCHGCSKSRKSAYNARKKKAARTDKTAVKLVTSGLARKLGGN